MTGDLRGKVEFPEAGEDYSLRFRVADLLKLQTKYGDDWFNKTVERLMLHDLLVCDECIKVGIKKNDQSLPPKEQYPQIADICEQFPYIEVANRVLDALFYSIYGTSKAVQFENILKDGLLKAGKAANPQDGPESTFETLDQPVSGPVSARTNSGA